MISKTSESHSQIEWCKRRHQGKCHKTGLSRRQHSQLDFYLIADTREFQRKQRRTDSSHLENEFPFAELWSSTKSCYGRSPQGIGPIPRPAPHSGLFLDRGCERGWAPSPPYCWNIDIESRRLVGGAVFKSSKSYWLPERYENMTMVKGSWGLCFNF